MIVTYALTGSVRRAMPSGKLTSSMRVDIDHRETAMATPCSTSTGSIFRRCVPTTTSITFPLDFAGATGLPAARRNRQPQQSACALFSCRAREFAETRIELLLGVLADAAGVDDDDVGIGVVDCRLVAGLIEQPGHTLRVVNVHLTAERLDEVFPCRAMSSPTFAFAFRFLFTFRVSMPSISRALARTGSVTDVPPIMRPISSIRPTESNR